MAKINSRAKGVRGELEWSQFLRKYGHDARRGQQHSGSPDSPDVKSSLDHLIHWEVKRTETLSPYRAISQAAADAAPTQIPVVAHKRNGKPWLCILPAESLLALLGTPAAVQALQMTSEGDKVTVAVLSLAEPPAPSINYFT